MTDGRSTDPPADVTVEEALAAIPSSRGRVREVTLLSGGLTNHNYLVRVDDTPYVVRFPGAQTELLAIDRENELYNTRAAALRILHGGPRFLRDFDMFRLTEYYLSVVDDQAIPVPDGYRELVVEVPHLERALGRRPLPSGPGAGGWRHTGPQR